MRRYFPLRPAGGSLLAGVLLAQSPPALAQTDPSGGQAICMRGALQDVAQIDPGDRGKPLWVLVAAGDAAAFGAKGFVTTDCVAGRLATPDAQRRWRDDVCALSRLGNESIQLQAEMALGEKPAVLCASAVKALGPSSQ